MTPPNTERHYSAGALARKMGVSPRTVERWCDRGIVRAKRTPGRHWRIPQSEVDRLLREGALPLAA